MLINTKLSYTDQKMLQTEDIHTCECVRKSVATTGSTTNPIENLHGEKSNIISLFSEFGYIGYVTKWENSKKKTTDKKFKAIMVGYAENHMRDMYNL